MGSGEGHPASSASCSGADPVGAVDDRVGYLNADRLLAPRSG
jgi:hypothetical protein